MMVSNCWTSDNAAISDPPGRQQDDVPGSWTSSKRIFMASILPSSLSISLGCDSGFSLAVDFDGPAPEPLPNLDYKIETGDSIGSPSPGTLQLGIQQQLVAEFVELKKQYFLLTTT